MYRPKHRPSAARVIGWTLVGLAYAATLVLAASLTAPAAGGVASAGAIDAALTATPQLEASTTALAGEAPLVTLAIAAAILVGAAGWYLLRALPRRRPLGQRARLVVRHITTLM